MGKVMMTGMMENGHAELAETSLPQY